MDKIINYTPEEMAKAAEALVGENLELRKQVDEMRGRLRESRRATLYYHRRYDDAMRYKYDAQTHRQRLIYNCRHITLAAVGATVLAMSLLYTAAACWGWWHG